MPERWTRDGEMAAAGPGLGRCPPLGIGNLTAIRII